MKKVLATFVMVICFTLCFSLTSFAASSTCTKSGCSRRRVGNSYYCSLHKCSHSGCKSSKRSDSNYCSSHTCQGGRTSCKNEVSVANAKCASCKNKRSTSKSASSSSKKSSYSKSNTSKATTKTKSSSTKKTTGNNMSRYDEGYEAISEDDDCDWDRYWSDSEYADGVDDAMEDYDW